MKGYLDIRGSLFYEIYLYKHIYFMLKKYPTKYFILVL